MRPAICRVCRGAFTLGAHAIGDYNKKGNRGTMINRRFGQPGRLFCSPENSLKLGIDNFDSV